MFGNESAIVAEVRDEKTEKMIEYVKSLKAIEDAIEPYAEQKRELREEFKDLQKQKKRVRPFFGSDRKTLRRQPVSSLMKAPYQQSAREKRAQKRFE